MTSTVRHICLAIVVSVAASLGIALLTALASATPAEASCESGIMVNTRELAFSYSDAIPMRVEDFPPVAMHAHFRGLAHALAVAQACVDTSDIYSCEAGTPTRTGISLSPGSVLAAVDTSDVNAFAIVRRCARADDDSVCVLWTCEIGRFRTARSAHALADGTALASEPGVLTEDWMPSRDATLVYDSCGGSWEPGTFVVHLGPSLVAPWATRAGLFFTREDALREAARWREGGLRVRVVRQRVDGALLEQALRQPMEGC
jgi:hypothetical protein